MLIFLAIVVFVGVNSTMDSIRRGGYDVVNGTNTRKLLYENYAQTEEEELSYIIDKFGDDKRVKNIYLSWSSYATMTGTQDLIGVPTKSIRLHTFHTEILDYGYKGEKKQLEYDEVILPRYIYDAGVYTEYTYADTNGLIGKKITIIVGKEKKEYNLKVIGNYDNAAYANGGDIVYVNGKFAKECRKENNNQSQGKVSIILEYGYDAAKIRDEFHKIVYEESDMTASVTQANTISEENIGFYNYAITVGNLVSLMLLFVAVVNIMISSITEVAHRKWEFALKMSMGYRKKHLIAIFMVEKVVNALQALIVSVIVLGVYSTVLTYYYKNLEIYWKRGYVISISAEKVMIAMILSVLAALTGVLVSRIIIKNIKISKVLKSKG